MLTFTGHLDARVVAACYSHSPFPDEDLEDGELELTVESADGPAD